MRNPRLIFTALLAFALAVPGTWYAYQQYETSQKQAKNRAAKQAKAERKKGRNSYFSLILRDPATKTIPDNIRAKELFHAKLIAQTPSNARTSNVFNYEWRAVGPFNIGGRTRAIAFDQRNPNIMLAGGVSGGMWKSTDGGASWALKTERNTNLSVASVAQDPRNPDTWYYSSGEGSKGGSTADGLGQSDIAPYLGSGIFKSTNNGDTWELVNYSNTGPGTWARSTSVNPFPTSVGQNPFAVTRRIVVSPTTSTIFVATDGFGILRSTDGGQTFTLVRENMAFAGTATDVAVDKDGNILAAVNGLQRSTDDGVTWTNVAPEPYPTSFWRSIIAIAPSNTNTAYSYMLENPDDANTVRVFKHNLSAGTFTEVTSNLPEFPQSFYDPNGVAKLNTQQGYCMTLGVHPNDENYVLIGGTELFRSFDGFATRPTDSRRHWIGGGKVSSDEPSPPFPAPTDLYFNHFVDQHVVLFHPTNSNIMISGNDGGVYRTDNIMADRIEWTPLNNGFTIMQSYHVALAPDGQGYRMASGNQDWGTVFTRYEQNQAFNTTIGEDVTGGDGTSVHLGENFAWLSTQNGNLSRYSYVTNEKVVRRERPGAVSSSVAFFKPANAKDLMWVNPFALDKNDENFLYFAGGSSLWRHSKALSNDEAEIEGSWQELPNIMGGLRLSAISTSKTPADIVYLGGYDPNGNERPKIFRMNGARTATTATEISIPDAAVGAYPVSIGVNPNDANEIMVVFANYNVVSLFHSTNGGTSYTAVEGNLAGTSAVPGPSCRWAEILPFNNEKIYLISTSTGLYSATELNGNNTSWKLEGPNVLGNAIVVATSSRTSDAAVAIGTHGQGLFLGIRTDAPAPTAPNAPVATGATNITETGFTANWNAVAGATGYFLDVATDQAFTNLVAGFSNKAVAGTSDAVTGLTANTDYFYRVRATNGTLTSNNSNVISTKTAAPAPVAPDAPVATAATSITETGFTANWNAVAGATGYFLDVATDQAFTNLVAGFSNKAVAGTSDAVTGLAANTDYFYRVRATNGQLTSVNSNVISTKTAAPTTPEPTAPDAPVATAATSITETGFTANWNAVAGATGYFLDVATDQAFTNLVAGFSNKTVNGTSDAVTGLTANTDYFYRVRATNGQLASGNSNVISTKTAAPAPVAPNAPVATAATNITETGFTANWNAVAGATGYLLDVATDQAFANLVAGFNNKTVNGTSDAVTGLTANTDYFYRVRATNGQLASGNSNVISTKTAAPAPVAPNAPVATAATNITETGFTANWNAVAGATGYLLDVATDQAFANLVAGFNNKAVAGTSDVVANLTPDAPYFYRVRATNGQLASVNSNVISARTSAPLSLSDDLYSQSLIIYPNPSNSYIQIGLENDQLSLGVFTCEVYDAKGSRVFVREGQLNTINTALKSEQHRLTGNSYLIRLSGENFNVTKRFVRN